MKFFKNLFSRKSRGHEALTKVGQRSPNAPSSIPPTSEDKSLNSNAKNTGSTAIPSPLPSDGRGEGQGEVRVPRTGELNSSGHQSAHISSPISPICPISPIPVSPDNSKLKTQPSTFSLTPDPDN